MKAWTGGNKNCHHGFIYTFNEEIFGDLSVAQKQENRKSYTSLRVATCYR